MTVVVLGSLLARGGSSHIHLTPQELNALWHLTRAIGQAFWRMTPIAQAVTVGVPGLCGLVWLKRWDPAAPKKGKW